MWRVFLSYHTPDRDVALALKRAIEAALPGAVIFVDQSNLRHGHLWQPALSEAIGKAEAFLILVSHRIGDWQKYEYYEARDRKAKEDSFVLLPIIIADRAKGPAANLPGLTQLHWIESTEPTAPDPLAKIVAALQARDVAKPSEPWRSINPYRGLFALEEQDGDFFFGRERETADILDRIISSSGRLIALIGNSGVGKSSLVQAGVVAALKRQRWPGAHKDWPVVIRDSRAWAFLAMKPGGDPIDALMSEFTAIWFPEPTDPKRVDRRREWATRLRQGNARLADLIKASDEHLSAALSLNPPPRYLLYIDQGEELYVRVAAAQRRRFSEIISEGLASSPERLLVITSQRSDHFGELQSNEALFNLTEVISVPPLAANALALVLSEPARILGVGFESDDLVRHVVKAAEDEPGALPLLADMFTDLWERMRERGDGTLRVSDHREIIQVGAALSKRADDFLERNPDSVESVKRLFTLRLAHVPRQGEPVRVRWERAVKPGTDPAADGEWALAELLAGSDWRLTVMGEANGKFTAEVAHEILLKSWPTLQRWLEEQRDFLIWRGELDARRKDFEQAGKAGPRQQRQALLMGLSLDTAKKHLAARGGDIEHSDRAFVEASVRAERAVARTWRRVQVAVGVLMLGTIAGLLGIIFKDEINAARFYYFAVRPYIAANFTPHVLRAEVEPGLKPGDRFRECAADSMACPEMVTVPTGEFLMGRPDGLFDNERPRHRVKIANLFAAGRFEVTWDEWEACVAMRGCDGTPTGDPGYGRGSRPVINVSWDQAKAYAAWLSRMTGKDYRLLTEAEWEYAARGITGTEGIQGAYAWGDDPAAVCRYANLADLSYRTEGNSGFYADCDDRHAVTAPVGSYPANAFGLHDMHGNVWEWVEDCWHPSYNGAPINGSAWIEGGDCENRVVRGGSWDAAPEVLYLAFRRRFASAIRYDALGFRVARTLATP